MHKKQTLVITPIAVIALIAIALLVLKLLGYSLTGQTVTTTMQGPVAVFTGDPPKHGFLGIDFVSLSKPLTVQGAVPGSGAADAGIQKGDQIIVAGTLQNPDLPALQDQLKSTSPGDLFPITIRRDGVDTKMQVRLISVQDLFGLRAQTRPVTLH